MISYEIFLNHLDELRERVKRACDRFGRGVEEIRILPVTKTFPLQAVEYCQRAGFTAVGENRVQEVQEKQGEWRHRIGWELIGHLQSNKAKLAVSLFDCIQTVESEKLALKLNRLASHLPDGLHILLQVNAGKDPAKYGLSIDEVDGVVEAVLKCDHLRLDGLMTIAPLSDDPSVARGTFCTLRSLRDRINRDFALQLNELSMGMTDDLEAAIAEGSTCIRVGTALFGHRA